LNLNYRLKSAIAAAFEANPVSTGGNFDENSIKNNDSDGRRIVIHSHRATGTEFW
jgi:hypothetical protein